MKKLSIVFIIIIVTALCGCGSNPPSNSTSAPSESSTETEIDISLFAEVETSSENLEIYRAEVLKRLKSLDEEISDTFVTEEEWKVIEEYLPNHGMGKCYISNHTKFVTKYNELFDETSRYYYPIVFREGNSLILWYTTESGTVLLKELYGYWFDSNVIGDLHLESDDTISTSASSALTYVKDTGEVQLWQFGELQETFTGIPQGAIYCGSSEFEGYIFRSGTDVYSLAAGGTYNSDGSAVCIAHNVQYVIDADYYFGSDPWCQPLFLMTDGSIKAYIGWEGDQDTPDSITHLCDLQYEGSYDK